MHYVKRRETMHHIFRDEPWHVVRDCIRSLDFPVWIVHNDGFEFMDDATFLEEIADRGGFQQVAKAHDVMEALQQVWPWWHEGEECPI